VSSADSLPDRLGRSQEIVGDEVVNGFACGLQITTEVLHKADARRILPIGGSTCCLLNRMVCFPEMVRGKRVCEPFAGSGPYGLMALVQGAAHADLIDINPRAAGFQRRNAAASGIGPERFAAIEADVAVCVAGESYDLVLANPPFVPTPDGIAGTLTSNGGADGSRLIEALLGRLDEWLVPDGEAWVLMFQLVVDGRPLLADRAASFAPLRPIEFIAGQAEPIPLEASCEAFRKLFPDDVAAIDDWRDQLEGVHGPGPQECQYVMHVGWSAGWWRRHAARRLRDALRRGVLHPGRSARGARFRAGVRELRARDLGQRSGLSAPAKK
jgi:hypothetical protein